MPPSAKPQERPGSLQEVLSGTTFSYRPSLFHGLRISPCRSKFLTMLQATPRCSRSCRERSHAVDPPGPHAREGVRGIFKYNKSVEFERPICIQNGGAGGQDRTVDTRFFSRAN